MEKAEKVVGGNKATLLRSIYRVPGSSLDASLLSFKPHNLKMGNTFHLIDERTKCVFAQGQRKYSLY